MAYEIDSRREREVYRAGTGGRVQTSAVSPDSRELAFVELEGNVDLKKESTVARIIPAAGGEARELIRSKPPGFLSYSVGGIAWSPDGRYLFMSECDGRPATASCELLRISAKGGEPQRLGITKEGLMPLCIHPDGRRIAFGSGQSKWSSSEIWVMEDFLHLVKNAQ